MQLSTITDRIPGLGQKRRLREAFWGVAESHIKFLYSVAFKYTGNRYDAEDLVQETLYTAYKKFHQLRDIDKLKSWMFTILRNHYFKAQRKKQPIPIDIPENEVDYVSQLKDTASQLDLATAYEKKVEAETVQSVLNELPEKYKSVLILYYMEDSSYQEIAELLGVPMGTVMSRLSRARKMMKKSVLKSYSHLNEQQENKVVRLNTRR